VWWMREGARGGTITSTQRAVDIYDFMPNRKGRTHRDKTSHRLLPRRLGF
jgi:hypothetical protein